jgi:hypothetical protein
MSQFQSKLSNPNLMDLSDANRLPACGGLERGLKKIQIERYLCGIRGKARPPIPTEGGERIETLDALIAQASVGPACIPASAANTDIAVISAEPGAGGTISVSAFRALE